MTDRAWFPLSLLVLSNVFMARLLRATLRAAMACGHSVALRSCSGLMTCPGVWVRHPGMG